MRGLGAPVNLEDHQIAFQERVDDSLMKPALVEFIDDHLAQVRLTWSWSAAIQHRWGGPVRGLGRQVEISFTLRPMPHEVRNLTDDLHISLRSRLWNNVYSLRRTVSDAVWWAGLR